METPSATRLAEKFKHDKIEQDIANQNSWNTDFDKDMDMLDTELPWGFLQFSTNYNGYREVDEKGVHIYLHIERPSESRIEERSRQKRQNGFRTERKTDRFGRPVLKISIKTEEEKTEEEKTETKSDPSETFDYLLRMQIVCLNIASKAYKELERKKSNLEAQIKDIENTTVEALWRREMQELKDAHKKWEKRIADDAKVPKRTKGVKAKAKE